jgi:hypothetical protein
MFPAGSVSWLCCGFGLCRGLFLGGQCLAVVWCAARSVAVGGRRPTIRLVPVSGLFLGGCRLVVPERGSLGGPGGGLRMGGAGGNHPAGTLGRRGKGFPGWFPPAALLA